MGLSAGQGGETRDGSPAMGANRCTVDSHGSPWDSVPQTPRSPTRWSWPPWLSREEEGPAPISTRIRGRGEPGLGSPRGGWRRDQWMMSMDSPSGLPGLQTGDALVRERRPATRNDLSRRRRPPRDGVTGERTLTGGHPCALSCHLGPKRGGELGRRSQCQACWAAGEPALEVLVRVDGRDLTVGTRPVRWKPAQPAGSGGAREPEAAQSRRSEPS